MKKLLMLILVMIVFLAPRVSAAQETRGEKTKEPATKLEAFLSKKGVLLVKSFRSLGEVCGKTGTNCIKFDAVVIVGPGEEKQKIKGIKIEITEGGRNPREHTSFLDYEEIESLSKALSYLLELSAQWASDSAKEYTEVVFSTKDFFTIGFFQKGTEQTSFSSSGYIGTARFFNENADALGSIKEKIDSGLNILKNL